MCVCVCVRNDCVCMTSSVWQRREDKFLPSSSFWTAWTMSLHVCVREKERGGGVKKEKEKGKLKQKKNVSLDEIPSKNK